MNGMIDAMATELRPGMLWRSQDGPWTLLERPGMRPGVDRTKPLSSCGLVVAVVEVVPGNWVGGTYVLMLDVRTGRFGWIRHRRFRA